MREWVKLTGMVWYVSCYAAAILLLIPLYANFELKQTNLQRPTRTQAVSLYAEVWSVSKPVCTSTWNKHKLTAPNANSGCKFVYWGVSVSKPVRTSTRNTQTYSLHNANSGCKFVCRGSVWVNQFVLRPETNKLTASGKPVRTSTRNKQTYSLRAWSNGCNADFC